MLCFSYQFVYVILVCLLPAFMERMQDQSPAIQDFLNGTPVGTLLSHKCIYRPGVLRTVIIMMLEAYYVYVYNMCGLNIYPGDTNSHPTQELMHLCFRDVGSVSVNQTNQDSTYTLLLSLPTSTPVYHMRHLDH